MEIKNLNYLPEPVIPKNIPGGSAPKIKQNHSQAESFQDILFREQANTKQVKVSAHAQQRLADRNITLNQNDWAKINNAITRAEAKGAVNSLLIHRDVALIVSVKNRTVISAMDDSQMKEHVFTNIDSAVIVK